MIFKINDNDFSNLVSGLKISYEVLVSDSGGKNANGDTVIDIVNRKRKINVTLRHTTNTEMTAFLAAVEGFIVEVTYLDAKTNTLQTARAYIGTPEPEYYTITDRTLYKPLTLDFIEL